MEKVLITGASGFVGANLTRLLLSKGYKIRLLIRKSSNPGNFKDLGVEVVVGDLLDRDSLQRAVKNCKFVFHVAADYRLWSKNPNEIYDNNVNGTKNLLEACDSAGVTRVVYTSSVATIGKPKSGCIGTENDLATLEEIVGHYKRSKFLAEQWVLKIAQKGFPVVVVNPSTPVGLYDIKPTPTGKIIVDFLNRKMPAYLQTGLNFVDVSDVAYGHYLALKHGTVGNRYILGGENLYLREFLVRLGKIINRPAPSIRIPWAFAYMLAGVGSLQSFLTQKEPFVPMEGVLMAKRVMFFDSSKAKKKLGYRSKPIDQSLRKAIGWFSAHGYTQYQYASNN